MNVKKFLAMLLAVAMLGGALAACGGGDTTSTPSGNTGTPAGNSETPTVETVDINVGYMPNYGGLWSLMTAKEKGFFEEEGLNVTMTQFEDGPTIIAAMENGSVNFGYIGQGAHKLCVQGNATIIALSHISNGDALIGGPGISTVEDLKGKVVAYSSGTSSEDILRNALAAHNMTMDDIQAMDMDAPSIVTAMMSGGVDACATWSPNSLTILEGMEGTTKLADNMTFSDTTVSLASWIATPKYLEENRDVTVRFVRALMKAMDYAADGPLWTMTPCTISAATPTGSPARKWWKALLTAPSRATTSCSRRTCWTAAPSPKRMCAPSKITWTSI